MVAVAHPGDSTSLLVQLCIKRLKSSAGGMTTKELAAELDDEITEGFSGITSSVLSSKLNAVFRRCKNVSRDSAVETLEELPLSRAQSTELPRRLVYKYTATEDPSNSGFVHSSSQSSSDSPTESTSASQTASGSSSNYTETLPTKNETLYKESNTDTSTPLTPKEDSEDNVWPPAKRQRTEPHGDVLATPQHDDVPRSTTPPNTASPVVNVNTKFGANAPSTSSKSGESSHGPSKDASSGPNASKFNLYYDVVDFEAVTAALDCGDISSSELAKSRVASTKSDPEHWVEYISPEKFALNELDQLIN